ncbi:hypothetical protein ACOM2C_16960 [Pseudarthrobacter sp. So.54]
MHLDAPTVEVKGRLRHDEADSDDFDLSDANTFKPSAMAISFKCRVPTNGYLVVTVKGAYYDKLSVHIPGVTKAREWWLRRPFELSGTVPGHVLLNENNRLKNVDTASGEERPRVAPTTQVFSQAGSRRA